MLPTTDVVVQSAKGSCLYSQPDLKGKRWLDFSASTNNLVLGHNSSSISKVLIDHLYQNKPFHLSSHYEDPILLKFVDTLQKVIPQELSVINHKLSNGSDAVEDTIKRVFTYHKDILNPKLLVFRNAHHGETIATIAASPKHHHKQVSWNRLMVPMFVSVPNYCDLNIVEDYFKISGIVGILLEPIMVNAGVILPPKDYLSQLRQLCNQYSKTLIFDEVQTAFGWLGVYTASEYWKVVPDLAAYGKGIGNGAAIAVAAMKPEYDNINYDETGFTSGGTPFSLAASISVIEEIKNYLNDVQIKGSYLLSLLKNIDYRFKDVRG